MHLVCPDCGALQIDPPVDPEGRGIVCPECSGRELVQRHPLFFVIGPSGAGKTTTLRRLRPVDGVILLDTDLLWGLRADYDDPDSGYRDFRDVCMTTALHLGQNGLPVALFGATTPDQNEELPVRRLFSETHYLALTCEEDELRRRLGARPAWRKSSEPEFIERTCDYNRWIRENADRTTLPMALVDTTTADPGESAASVRDWLTARLEAVDDRQ